MRSLICFVLLTSCLIYYGTAAGNTNQIELVSVDDTILGETVRQKRDADGGETKQDPNVPKYQKMAEDLVRNNLRIKTGNVKNIKVIRVTTQVVEGTITRIEIRITLVNGNSDQCNFKVWDKPRPPVRHVSYTCLAQSHQKALSGISGTPRPKQTRDPKDPKYQKLAKTLIDYFSKIAEKDRTFNKEDITKIHLNNVKVQIIDSKIMTEIQFNIITLQNDNYLCTSTLMEEPWNPEGKVKVTSVKCELIKGKKLLLKVSPSILKVTHSKSDEQLNQPGGEVHENPDDPLYKQLASESFQRYLNSHHNVKVHVKSNIKVNSVTSQLVAGKIIRIKFHVYPIGNIAFMCQSEIIQELSGRYSNFDVSCGKEYGGEVEQDPDEPQFQQLAKESFRNYRETHIGPLFVVKELKVTRATTQVVAGLITRLDFYVTTTEGRKLTCNSNVYDKSWKRIKNIHVNCTRVPTGNNVKLSVKQSPMSKSDDQLNQPGGIVYENPDDPPYKQLANESFQRYLNSHLNLKVQVKGIRIDSVSSQLVAGTIVRIHFHVYITRERFACKSKIFQELSGRYSDFDVSCHKETGFEEEQDPDEPRFQQLAKESFRKYQETHIGPQFADKELKVTRVTIEILEGEYTRLDFYVITTEGGKLTCHSTIFEQWWNKYKTIDVNCNRVQTGG